MAEENEQRQHEEGCIWETIPPERTFCEIKLFLDEVSG